MQWINTFTNNYQQILNPSISGAKRGLQEGIGQRFDGFKIMFELLLKNKTSDFLIIETGTLRNPGNWKDGQSARLFTEFVEFHGGQVRSVDIDPIAVDNANRALTSNSFQAYCSDSVAWLQDQTDLSQVDLFYLDSWDVKWKDDTLSAEHHLKEFQSIEPYLRSGSIVAIDDNARFVDSNLRTGKGRRIVEYLEAQGKLPIYDKYQIIYTW